MLGFAGVWASPATAQADDCPGGVPDNPAGSATVWTDPQCLSASEGNGEVPQVAIADDGTAIAVWRSLDLDAVPTAQEDKDRWRVQFAIRRRGQNFSVPPANATPAQREATYLSGRERDVGSHIRLKMNKRGDAIVVWEVDEGNGKVGIRSAYKPAGGAFGPEQVVAPGGRLAEPEVGIDGQGAATVIYHPRPGPFGDVSFSSKFVSRSRPQGVDAIWGDERSLIRHDVGPPEFPIDYNETHGSLAVNENGDRYAVFASQREGRQRQVVYEAFWRAGEANWVNSGPQDDTSKPDVEVTSTNVAYSGDGQNVVRSWTEGSDLLASYRREERPINPPFGGPVNRSGDALAIDSASDYALALWSDGGALRAATAPPTGPFRDPDGEPVPGGSGETIRTRPALAAYGEDSAVAVLKEQVGDNETVQAALRPAGGTTKFDAPIRLSAEGDTDLEDEGDESGAPFAPKRGTGPKVAANSSGEAVAAWSVSDGQAANVVQVSLLTPRRDPVIPPPPPPPPRPKPAVSSPIQLARPLARDKAVVLIANIPGSVDELQWSFGSRDEPPIVGKVEGGQLQRTVRLRLPNNSFTARVRAVGPDGPREFSRSFTALKPSSSRKTREVVEGLKKADTPPVFAVGNKETLTAQSSECSPSTIWSGQQKMSGCFKPIEELVDIPARERGAIHEVGDQLNLDWTKTELMQKATELTDGYVAEGRALLNDRFPVTPSEAADVVTIPQAKALISARAELPVGGGSYDPQNGFNLRLDPKKTTIPLGRLPNPPRLPSLAGLEIVGDWNVDLDKQEAKIKASVKFPPAIKKAGVSLSNEVTLRATPERVIIDDVRVGPIDVNIAALKVNAFQIQYKREPNQWDGQGKACIVLACLDMIPPNGGVTIKDGDLAFAGGTLQFPPPGVPVFTGVNLERIGFGIGLRPTRINANARVGVGQILKLDGRVFMAFPDSQTPYVLDRREAGNAFPPRFYGQRFTRTTLGATAEAFVAIPIVGETRLASAYALYEYPDYAAFGGGINAEFLGVVRISGGLDAEADFGDGLFNLHGSAEACIHVIEDLCSGAVGNVSRGRGGTGGAGACIKIGPVSVGGGVQWKRLSEPFIWPFDGCKWSRFRATVRESNVGTARAVSRGARAARGTARAARGTARAAASLTVDVKPGESPAVQLSGSDAAPFIRVSGPGGSLSSNAGTGFARSPDNTIRIMRFQNAQAKFAVVGFQKANPGRYTIDTLPGSPAITAVKEAEDPPPAKVTGEVRGRGSRRVLHYDVRPREDQKVIFDELGPGGTAKRIGAVDGGGRGKVGFRPAPGRGRRKVVAQFVLAGINAERRAFTSFRPPSPSLATPRRLRARHRASRLLVSWRRVRGATRYEVAAALSSRRMVFKTTRRTRATLRVPRYLRGRVTVQALDRLRQSRLASRRFGGWGRQPSPFRPLLNCRIVGARIICAPRGSRCGGRVPTISASQGRRTRGTRRADVIVGSSGRDRIDGGGGKDIICAGAGNDRISGSAGDDRLFGGAGHDRLHGRSGDDRLDGGSGRDRLKGGLGDDGIVGGSGNDVVVGGEGRGRDTIEAGSGDDRIETRDRGVRDRVDCGPGRDRARVDRADRRARCERLRFR